MSLRVHALSFSGSGKFGYFVAEIVTSNQGSPCKNYMQTLHIYVEQVGISHNKLTQMLHKNCRDT